MGKKQFCFFQTAETGNRTPDSGVKGSGANHYPRAPARYYIMYETTIKFQFFIFDPEKSVVLFSHPTQPTHELGDLDKPRTYW